MESIKPSDFMDHKFEEVAKKIISSSVEMLEITGTPFFVTKKVPDDAICISKKEFEGTKVYLCQRK